jgi:hypothetical protein
MSASTDANAQASSSSADSTNLTWTETDQDMLDNLTRQSEMTADLVTHSQRLVAPTRPINEALSPGDSTIDLKADIMWQTRTGDIIRRFLAREMRRQAQSASTNSPT